MVDGLFNYTGKLEFCAHGRWGEVCNNPELWGPDNTKVVCHQLGFPEEGKENTLYCLIYTTLQTGGAHILEYGDSFETNKKDAVIGGVQCVGTEPELIEFFMPALEITTVAEDRPPRT